MSRNTFDRMGRLTAQVGQDSRADRPAGIRAAVAQIKSGQTVPAEEVDAWIESWDTPAELQIPEPRR
jgi:predicted transcriptional regulator